MTVPWKKPTSTIRLLIFAGLAVAAEVSIPLTHICDTTEGIVGHGVSVPVQSEGGRPSPFSLMIGTDKQDDSSIWAIANGSLMNQVVNTSIKIPSHKSNESFSGFTEVHSAGNMVSFMGVDSSVGINRWRGAFALQASAGDVHLCTIVEPSMDIPCGDWDGCDRGKFGSDFGSASVGPGGVFFFRAASESKSELAARGSIYEGIFRAVVPQFYTTLKNREGACTANISVTVDSLGTTTLGRHIYDIGDPSTSVDGRTVTFAAQDGKRPGDASSMVKVQGQQGMLGGPTITIFVLELDAKGHGTLRAMAGKSTPLPLLGAGPSHNETFAAFSDPWVDRTPGASSIVFMGQGSLGTIGIYHLNTTSRRICAIVDTTTDLSTFDPACITVDNGVVAFCALGSITGGIYATRLPECGFEVESSVSSDEIPSFIPIAMLGDTPPSPQSREGRFSYLLARAESLASNVLAFYGVVEGGATVGYDGVYTADLGRVFGAVGREVDAGRGREVFLV